jgi:peptide subunit release factor 1 (eRF1)
VSWLLRVCKEREITVALVSDSTRESAQLIRGLDGIGGAF